MVYITGGYREEQKKMKKESLKKLIELFIICLTLSLGSCATTENDLKKANRQQPLTSGPPAYIYFEPGKLNNGQVEIQAGLRIKVTPAGYEPKSMPKDTDFTFSAYVCDANGRQTNIKPNWKASKPDILLITPLEGNEVTVRGMMKGVTDIIIEASGMKTVVPGIVVE